MLEDHSPDQSLLLLQARLFAGRPHASSDLCSSKTSLLPACWMSWSRTFCRAASATAALTSARLTNNLLRADFARRAQAGRACVTAARPSARGCVSPCWAQALIMVLRPALGEARSPRSQTYHLASRDEVPAPSRGLRPTTLAGEEALEFDQRRLRRFEQRRSATARREVDAAVAGLRGEPRPAVPLWGGQAEHELVLTVDGNISPK